jgi:hypothetical protein
MYKILFNLLFVLLPFQGFCIDRFLEPIKFQDQEEFYIQGGMGLLSQKQNSIIFYPTTPCLMDGKANFYFIFSNDSDRYENVLVQNVRVTDQYGRPVRMIPVQEHLDRLRSSANWKSFFNFAIGAIDLCLAQDAGRVDYHRSYQRNVHGFNGRTCYGHHEQGCETGTYYSRALQRAAERESILAASFRERGINNEYQLRKMRYENFYLSSNTVPPRSVYSANFQIDVPRFMEVDLQYLYITFNVGCETHTFALHCGNSRQQPHRPSYF